MMLRTPVCSYPVIVTYLSFNFLCLLLLYSIYLNGDSSSCVERLYCKRPIQCLASSKILTPHPLNTRARIYKGVVFSLKTS